MKTIKELRTYIGLSQGDLAEYLGISRSTLIQTEQGISSLNAACLLKVARIEMCLQEPVPANTLSETEPDHRQRCGEREQTCRYNMALLQRKLNELETTHAQNARLLHILDVLEHSYPDDQTWIHSNRQKAAARLQACSQTIRDQLSERIYLLSAEADYLSQYLEKQKIPL